MGIFLTSKTKVIVCDIASEIVQHQTDLMSEYGTKIVGGVSFSKTFPNSYKFPIYGTIDEAVSKEMPDAIALFAQPNYMKKAALDAITAGIKLIVIMTEHIPIHDTMEIVAKANFHDVNIIGPNTSGLIAPPSKCKIGFVPSKYFIPGKVGILARSSSLAYELVSRLTAANIGQSLCVNVGGDAIVGTTFSKMGLLFESDPDTELILLIGEPGGSMEENIAEHVKKGRINKPIIAYLAGRWVPVGKRVGHAGAIVSSGHGSIKSKIISLSDASIPVARVPNDLVYLVQQAITNIKKVNQDY